MEAGGRDAAAERRHHHGNLGIGKRVPQSPESGPCHHHIAEIIQTHAKNLSDVLPLGRCFSQVPIVMCIRRHVTPHSTFALLLLPFALAMC